MRTPTTYSGEVYTVENKGFTSVRNLIRISFLEILQKRFSLMPNLRNKNAPESISTQGHIKWP